MMVAYAAGFYYGLTVTKSKEQWCHSKEDRNMLAKDIRVARNELKKPGERRLFSVAYQQGKAFNFSIRPLTKDSK